MKKAVMVLAPEQFQEMEYFPVKEILEKAGIAVKTASSLPGKATGKTGTKADIDMTLGEIDMDLFDALLFVGGPGSFNYYDDRRCHEIASAALEKKKLLGAICAAPGILARAGLLRGKKATMFSDTGEIGKWGGTFTGNNVEIDGDIVTAMGPDTAKAWGEAIVNKLGTGL